MLIKSYGEFWNPFTVDWENKTLKGKGPKEFSQINNFWEAKGIYLMMKDFKPVYVGKAFGDTSGIGPRLKAHLTDRFAGRWDMFSWYSVSKPNKINKGVQKVANRQLKMKTVVDTLEALSILITDPPLNRSRESIPGAWEFIQSDSTLPKSNKQYLEEILSALDEKNQ